MFTVQLYLFTYQRNIEAQNNRPLFGKAAAVHEFLKHSNSQNFHEIGSGMVSGYQSHSVTEKNSSSTAFDEYLFQFFLFFSSNEYGIRIKISNKLNHFSVFHKSESTILLFAVVVRHFDSDILHTPSNENMLRYYHFGVWIAAKVQGTTLAMELADIAAVVQSYVSENEIPTVEKICVRWKCMQIRVKWMKSEHVLCLDLNAMCEWIPNGTENRIDEEHQHRARIFTHSRWTTSHRYTKIAFEREEKFE